LAFEVLAVALGVALASLLEGIEASDELLEGDVVDDLAGLDEREIDLLAILRAAGPLVVVPRSAA